MLFDGLEEHSFRVVVADPPWPHDTWSPKGEERSASQHYSLMTLKDIKALPVRLYAELDAWLCLWVPGPLLAIGAHVPIMQAWGFAPSSMGFTWIKTTAKADLKTLSPDRGWHVGLGKTTRHNPEFCVLGRMGSPARRSMAVRELIVAPVREHSRKPDEFYRRVESLTYGPRLELFGRQQRNGWIVRGDESSKYSDLDSAAKTS